MTSLTSLNEDQSRPRADIRGRVRIPAERRQALLAEFDTSGLTGAAFARLAGVEYQTFMGWLRSRRKQAGASAAASPGDNAPAPAGIEHGRHSPVAFLEAALPELRSSVALTVELPGGARIEIRSPHQLALAAELLRMVSSPRQRPC